MVTWLIMFERYGTQHIHGSRNWLKLILAAYTNINVDEN